ncbi:MULTISPECIES: NAD-dependent epimerase/dehydratase family protein [Flavobacteriaceae]|uniref:NAD-dependent epimerase/dehydratase family protein n=1 Tax=Flavobacteriaceae TaxID=49546 RepID=UPI002348F0E0|nr:NAD(P)-dependent oxidoreductase [Muricauda sp. SP22]MDC6363807.1 NAD(P)-dependent oxidoreductase [Muricauda sp. SP22]
MNKIVITGSSGRIGRALHWKLCQNYDVSGIDTFPSSVTSKIVDIRDYEQLLWNFEGMDTIFHVAALHAPHVGIASEKEFYDINVTATEKICRAAIETGVSQIIFTSTTALYGFSNNGSQKAVWINEQTIPKPKTIYHKTKLEAETIMKEYSKKSLAVSVIRMSRCFPEPVQIMASYRLHRGVDYRDVAEAHLLAAQLEKNKNFDVYLISADTPFLKTDSQLLFENPEAVIRMRHPLLAKELDKRGWKFPESIDRVYDSSYSQKILGWRPKNGPLEVFKQFDNGDYEILPPS